MKTKWAIIVSIILSLAVLVFGLVVEASFPAQMAVHWGANGEVNGYGSHFTGIWLLPLMVIGLTFLLAFIPNIDPLKKNIETFREEYNLFIVIFAVYMNYIQLLTLLANMGAI